ncbi:MAG: hypothetical protein K0R57_1071 [Paenibacillaceae bacterium]|nr:hypothetical protein [Paenibacillaceae bacterium]
MKSQINLGHNVIQLFYPLRLFNACRRQKSLIDVFEDSSEWVSFHNGKQQDKTEYYFSQYVDVPADKVIADQDLEKYFHPSVQEIFFKDEFNLIDRREGQLFRAFRKEVIQRQRDISFKKKSGDVIATYSMEWLSCEVFLFSHTNGFLVNRFALHENVKIDSNGTRSTNLEEGLQGNLELQDWSRFSNLIRSNYSKYDGQSTYYLHQRQLIMQEERKNTTVADWFHVALCMLPNQVFISSRYISTETYRKFKCYQNFRDHYLSNIHRFIESSAFSHNLLGYELKHGQQQSEPMNAELNTQDLSELLCIDSDESSSGSTADFNETFVRAHSYERWRCYGTYYMGLDYGATTLIRTKEVNYKNQQGSVITDLNSMLIQHHCKHYLLFMLLQLYYRDELQELMGQYARIRSLEQKKFINVAKNVLSQYYFLNQHYFFDRVSNEIQGLELWKFYQKVLGIQELHHSVQQDMNELNQRIIQAEAIKQNGKIHWLTILTTFVGVVGANLLIGKYDWSSAWNGEAVDKSPLIGTNWDKCLVWGQRGLSILVFASLLYVFGSVISLFFKWLYGKFKSKKYPQ